MMGNDTVLDGYDHAIFVGNSSEVRRWLQARPSIQNKLSVRICGTGEVVTVGKYLKTGAPVELQQDIVIAKNGEWIFCSTSEEVVKYLRQHPDMRLKDFGVFLGDTAQVISVNQYLTAVEEREKVASDSIRRRVQALLNRVSAHVEDIETATDEIIKLFEEN